jgi:hypothetical protein
MLTAKKWFPSLETIFVFDHMLLPLRLSLLRKEETITIHCLSRFTKFLKIEVRLIVFFSRNNDLNNILYT